MNAFLRKLVIATTALALVCMVTFGPLSQIARVTAQQPEGTPTDLPPQSFVGATPVPYTPAVTVTPADRVAAQVAAGQTPPAEDGQPRGSCSIGLSFSLFDCMMYGFALLAWGVFFIAGRILFFAGMLLDWSIKASVVFIFSQTTTGTFGQFAVSLTSAINTGWGAVRDVANIFFIFILLYSGIKMIVGQEDHPGTQIKNVVIMAFLINFSLLFTRLIIDASNILALVFYKILVPNDTVSISSLFLNGLLLNSVFNNAALTPGAQYYFLAIIAYIMASVVAIVAAWVFLSAAITFVVRTVTLLILMILSPLAFAAFAFPDKKINSNWSKWQETLVENCMVAPAYLFLIWICAYLINAMLAFNRAGGGEAGLGGAIASINDRSVASTNIYIVFFTYAIVIGLIWGSLKVSKTIAGYTSDAGRSAVGSLAGFAVGGLAGGIGGSLLRNTLGRGAASLAGKEGFKDYASKSKIGKMLYSGTKSAAAAGYDIRNTSLAMKTKEKTGLKMGSGVSAGFADLRKQKIDARAKKEVEFAESLGVNKKQIESQQAIIRNKDESLSVSNNELRQLEFEKLQIDNTPAAARTAAQIARLAALPAEIQAKEQDIQTIQSEIRNAKTTIKTVTESRSTAYKNALVGRSVLSRIISKPTTNAGKDKAAKDIDTKLETSGLEDEIKTQTTNLQDHRAEIKRLRDKLRSGRMLTPEEDRDLRNALGGELEANRKIREAKFKLSKISK